MRFMDKIPPFIIPYFFTASMVYCEHVVYSGNAPEKAAKCYTGKNTPEAIR